MKTILFATSNQRKLKEAVAGCLGFGIKIKQVELEILEIQAHDPKAISIHKATAAFEQVQKPVVVTDTSWNILALNGFPGGYMKDVAAWFSPRDFLNLVRDNPDKRLTFRETIVYKDEKQVKVFSKEFWGRFARSPRGSGNSIEQIAEFGGHTIGERRDQGKLSHEPKDYVWVEFARWFTDQSKGV